MNGPWRQIQEVIGGTQQLLCTPLELSPRFEYHRSLATGLLVFGFPQSDTPLDLGKKCFHRFNNGLNKLASLKATLV